MTAKRQLGMLELFLGRAGSGKSERAEDLLRRAGGPTLYVATLPPIAAYEDVIRRHRLRRPASWDLLELVGEPREDWERLGRALVGVRNILVDGLSGYLLRIFHVAPEVLQNYRREWTRFLRNAQRSNLRFVVVDVHPLPRRRDPPDECVRWVRRSLLQHARRGFMVEEGRMSPMRRPRGARRREAKPCRK